MSAISERFASLRREHRTGFVAYVTAGDPDLARSAEILVALDRAGADFIEVGVPYSDPVADGPVIERAAARGLAAGGSLRATLDLVRQVRPRIGVPLILFTYLNPLLRLGLDVFARRASEAGVSGVLVLDLPAEESGECRTALDAAGLETIFLVSPTTTEARLAHAARMGRGFLYAISRLGVTGARQALPEGARDLVARIRRRTGLPVALGFGISTAQQVQQAAEWADAVVVGSAVVSEIERWAGAPDVAARIGAFVRTLRAPLDAGAGGAR